MPRSSTSKGETPTDVTSKPLSSSLTTTPITQQFRTCTDWAMRLLLTLSLTMMMKPSGLKLESTNGPRRWQDPDWSLKSFLQSKTTLLLVFVLPTSGLEATISSLWWKNRDSCMIPPSLLLSRILHCGHTQCTSRCPTDVMETSRVAPQDPTLCGRWWWTSLTEERILPLMRIFQDVPWLTLAPTFSLETSSTTSSLTISTDILTRTEPHLVSSPTLPGWKIIQNFWMPSSTGWMRPLRTTKRSTLWQWPRSSSGSKALSAWMKPRTLPHGKRSVPQDPEKTVWCPTAASSPQTNSREKKSSCTLVFVAPTSTPG